MATPDSPHAADTPEFRSPKRALARAFRISREGWKRKAGERRKQIKALQIRVRDLEVSRDLWKEKALHLQGQVEQLLTLASSERDAEPSVSALPQQSAIDPVAAPSLPQDPLPPQPAPPPVTQPASKKKRSPHR
jgi:hypothetical protein